MAYLPAYGWDYSQDYSHSDMVPMEPRQSIPSPLRNIQQRTLLEHRAAPKSYRGPTCNRFSPAAHNAPSMYQRRPRYWSDTRMSQQPHQVTTHHRRPTVRSTINVAPPAVRAKRAISQERAPYTSGCEPVRKQRRTEVPREVTKPHITRCNREIGRDDTNVKRGFRNAADRDERQTAAKDKDRTNSVAKPQPIKSKPLARVNQRSEHSQRASATASKPDVDRSGPAANVSGCGGDNVTVSSSSSGKRRTRDIKHQTDTNTKPPTHVNQRSEKSNRAPVVSAPKPGVDKSGPAAKVSGRNGDNVTAGSSRDTPKQYTHGTGKKGLVKTKHCNKMSVDMSCKQRDSEPILTGKRAWKSDREATVNSDSSSDTDDNEETVQSSTKASHSKSSGGGGYGSSKRKRSSSSSSGSSSSSRSSCSSSGGGSGRRRRSSSASSSGNSDSSDDFDNHSKRVRFTTPKKIRRPVACKPKSTRVAREEASFAPRSATNKEPDPLLVKAVPAMKAESLPNDGAVSEDEAVAVDPTSTTEGVASLVTENENPVSPAHNSVQPTNEVEPETEMACSVKETLLGSPIHTSEAPVTEALPNDDGAVSKDEAVAVVPESSTARAASPAPEAAELTSSLPGFAKVATDLTGSQRDIDECALAVATIVPNKQESSMWEMARAAEAELQENRNHSSHHPNRPHWPVTEINPASVFAPPHCLPASVAPSIISSAVSQQPTERDPCHYSYFDDDEALRTILQDKLSVQSLISQNVPEAQGMPIPTQQLVFVQPQQPPQWDRPAAQPTPLTFQHQPLFPTPPQSEGAYNDFTGEHSQDPEWWQAILHRAITCPSCNRVFNRAFVCCEYVMKLNRPIQCICGCVLCSLCYKEQMGCRAHGIRSTRGVVNATANGLASCPQLENFLHWNLELKDDDNFKADHEANLCVQRMMKATDAPDVHELQTAFVDLLNNCDKMSFKWEKDIMLPQTVAYRYVCIPHVPGFWDHVLVGTRTPPETAKMMGADVNLPKLFNVSMGSYKFHWCCFVLKKEVVLALWCTSDEEVFTLVDDSLTHFTSTAEFRNMVFYLSKWFSVQYSLADRQLHVVLDCKPFEGASVVHIMASMASKIGMDRLTPVLPQHGRPANDVKYSFAVRHAIKMFNYPPEHVDKTYVDIGREFSKYHDSGVGMSHICTTTTGWYD